MGPRLLVAKFGQFDGEGVSNWTVIISKGITRYRLSMSTRLSAVFAATLVFPFMTGCLGLGAKKETAPKPKIVGFAHANTSDGTKREPRLVGRVEMVNEEGKFVLVHCDAWMAPPAGTALKCMRGGVETGVVNVNAERRGANVTADIVTGKPERGDQAYQ